MTRDDLVRFAHRDWAAIEDVKTAFWIESKRQLSAADLLRLGDELRRHASIVRPDYPSQVDRTADLADHDRVTRALRAVTRLGPS